MQFIFASTATFVVFAINCVSIYFPDAFRATSSGPISPQLLFAPFLVFGVFSYYETENHELRIWGSRGEVDDAGKEKWQLMSTEEHFPFSRGAKQSRLWASHHLRDLSRAEHWKVWLDMGNKIRERHNRLHPEQAITRVGFQSRSWPRSAGGYYERVEDARVTRFWVVTAINNGKNQSLDVEPSDESLPYRE